MERYHVIGGHLRLDPEGTVTSYADAQRALDAEREKAKQLDRTLADVYQQRDGLQAQLRQVEGERTVDVANSLIPFKAGDWIRFKWVDGDAEGIVTGHNHGTVLFSNESVGSGFIELQNIVAHVSRANHDELFTLRQLVAALPVVEVDGVIVWAAPDESGWFVSKRPAPTGTYWAKFKTQEDAKSFLALLKSRATLAAQIEEGE